ncbi:MAG: AAA family ATPase, partial [Thermoguttaceae bacterium]|nr:AAA family ATPase [Thermoguttaceae bacterium]
MTEFRENRDVRRPFLSTPDARVYFPASAIEKARRSVARCLRRGEGVALVVGEPGMGKTLLARTLASEFDGQDQASVVSASRKLNVKAFLQQFMFGLRQKFCGCDETEMRLMTLDYLERSPQRRCVLLVDDAHNLSAPVFDEIRTLVDQAAGASKELAVALFGGAALEDRLNLPQLYPFQQRIVCRAYLDAFSYAETRRFIDRELKRSGIAASFTKDAKDKVANLSAGVPRVITQICDRALWLASDGALELSDGEAETSEAPKKRAEPFWTIDIKEIERAWNNLQNIKQEEEEEEESEPPAADDSSPTVEFGLLDDDEDGEYNESGGSEEPVPQENNVTVTVETEFNSSASEETPEAPETSETVEVSTELDNDDDDEE